MPLIGKGAFPLCSAWFQSYSGETTLDLLYKNIKYADNDISQNTVFENWFLKTHKLHLNIVSTETTAEEWTKASADMNALISNVTAHRNTLQAPAQPPWDETISELQHYKHHLDLIPTLNEPNAMQKARCLEIGNGITTI